MTTESTKEHPRWRTYAGRISDLKPKMIYSGFNEARAREVFKELQGSFARVYLYEGETIVLQYGGV